MSHDPAENSVVKESLTARENLQPRRWPPPPGSALFWPCPNNCLMWCRTDGSKTNHHPRCQHVDASLIDVWRVSYDGASYVLAARPLPTHHEETVTREKMHREIYENLPEFGGF